MSNIELTSDSDALICLMYKAYCNSRNNGINKFQAKQFGSSEDIQSSLTPNWSKEDTLETCRELARANLLDCSYADGIIYTSYLTDQAIIYMESRFKNNLSDVLEYIGKIKNIIPFV